MLSILFYFIPVRLLKEQLNLSEHCPMSTCILDKIVLRLAGMACRWRSDDLSSTLHSPYKNGYLLIIRKPWVFCINFYCLYDSQGRHCPTENINSMSITVRFETVLECSNIIAVNQCRSEFGKGAPMRFSPRTLLFIIFRFISCRRLCIRERMLLPTWIHVL